MKTFFEGNIKNGLHDLCGRKFVGKSRTKLFGKFGEVRAKIVHTSKSLPILRPMQ